MDNRIDIYKALDLARIFIGNNILIRINSKIKYFERISKMFSAFGISYESYTPVSDIPKRFDLHFGREIDFQDLFILVGILKNFGLQSIFYTGDCDNQLVIGSYITECEENQEINEGITVDEILNLPFSLTTKEFLNRCYNMDTDLVDEFDFDELDVEDEYLDDDPHNNHWEDSELYMGDWEYDQMNPAHCPSENPWIDVFGPGDEAETAYWNTH